MGFFCPVCRRTHELALEGVLERFGDTQELPVLSFKIVYLFVMEVREHLEGICLLFSPSGSLGFELRALGLLASTFTY